MSLILRGYSSLNQNDIEIGGRGSTLLPQRILQAANSLWESITGGAALGASDSRIRPHDHSPDGGGVSIPRGCIYTFDVGDDQDSWRTDFPGLETEWNRSLADRRFDFPVYVTPGIDSSIDSVVGGSVKCFLAARVLCHATAAGGEIRLSNTSRGSSPDTSSIINPTPTITWYSLSDVPCVGGQYNLFNLETRNMSGSVNQIRVYALSLHEIRAVSQPETSGAHLYSAVPRP